MRREQTDKPGSNIIVMVPVVPAVVFKAEYDYGTCVLSQVPQTEFNLVCGTAGTTKSGKSNLMSFWWSGVLHSLLSKWLQESKKHVIFSNFFFLVIEDSTDEEIKSKLNTNFGLVKYFNNVNKMDNSTDCLLNWDLMAENTFTDRSRQYKFQIWDWLK